MPPNNPVEKEIASVLARLAAADSLTPGIKIVYDMRNGEVRYMSPAGLAELEITLDELREMGHEYNRRFFNPEQSEEYVPQLFAMLRNDPDGSFTFFQQASAAGKEWKWYLSAVHVLLKDADGSPVLSLTIAHLVDPVSHLTPKVARMLEEHAFIKEHQQLFDTLGEREKTVLSLLSKGHTNLEVSAALSISVSTVETHRKNIRRKLRVTTNAELGKYSMAFDLI